METFKEKKLAEFDEINENSNTTASKGWTLVETKHLRKFISDLIDEMETNLFLKDIVTKARIDTLKKVLDIVEHPLNGEESDCDCAVNIKNLVSSLWDIDLTKD